MRLAMTHTSPSVAIILAGSGYLDGAEIREAVLTLLSLDTHGANVSIFAPNMAQHHVINHLSGKETDESRNVLVEAARIARGNIQPLSKLDASEYDALVIPGGFGVAKNLSDLAFKGPEANAIDGFSNIVRAFHSSQKPIGAICIAPAVIASVLGEHNPTLTIGEDEGTAGAIEAMGATHQHCETSDIVIDEQNNIVSCSAYMREDSISNVAEGIDKLIKKVIVLAQTRSIAA